MRAARIFHALCILLLPAAIVVAIHDDLPRHLRTRGAGIPAKGRVTEVTRVSLLGAFPRGRVHLEVNDDGRTFEGSAYIIKAEEGRFRPDRTYRILYVPEQPDFMVLVDASGPHSTFLAVLGLSIGGELFLIGLLWCLANGGSRIFRQGERTLGALAESINVKGIAFCQMEIEVGGKTFKQATIRPSWAIDGYYEIAYLAKKPDKMVPIRLVGISPHPGVDAEKPITEPPDRLSIQRTKRGGRRVVTVTARNPAAVWLFVILILISLLGGLLGSSSLRGKLILWGCTPLFAAFAILQIRRGNWLRVIDDTWELCIRGGPEQGRYRFCRKDVLEVVIMRDPSSRLPIRVHLKLLDRRFVFLETANTTVARNMARKMAIALDLGIHDEASGRTTTGAK